MGADGPEARAPLVELFGSVQGEGRHAGRPMAFVRVATCPIRCLYCDTPDSYRAPAAVAVEGADDEPNPVGARRAAELVDALCRASQWERADGPRLPASLTGGEPLVVPRFAHELGAALAAMDRALHLETAALDPDALAEVLPVVAHLSADWKLPGTLEAGDFRDQHAACLQLALHRGVPVDAKLVLTPDVPPAAVVDAAARIAGLVAAAPAADLVVVLQPVTPFGRVVRGVDPAALPGLAAPFVQRGLPVRVLPQLHKMLEVR